MYYSITFGNKNTWDDWHIVPTTRPLVNPPKPKTEYVDTVVIDGSLDYTEVNGPIKKGNREGSWEFLVMNGYQEWYQLYNEIINYIHGKKMYITLESEPGKEYYGRLFVDSWSSEKDFSKITIRYIIDVYDDSEEGVDYRILKVLSYIETTGTQYINTQTTINPNYITEVEVGLTNDLITRSIASGHDNNLFGINDIYNVNFDSTFETLQAYRCATDDYTVASRDSFVVPDEDYDPSDLVDTFKRIRLSNVFMYGNDIAHTFNRIDFGYLCSYNLYLFASNNKNASADGCGFFRIRSVKIYQTSSYLIRNIVPVKKKSDGTVCFYDRMSKEILYNAGTGDFIAGEETGEEIIIRSW